MLRHYFPSQPALFRLRRTAGELRALPYLAAHEERYLFLSCGLCSVVFFYSFLSSADALEQNQELEFSRNRERFLFCKVSRGWGGRVTLGNRERFLFCKVSGEGGVTLGNRKRFLFRKVSGWGGG